MGVGHGVGAWVGDWALATAEERRRWLVVMSFNAVKVVLVKYVEMKLYDA